MDQPTGQNTGPPLMQSTTDDSDSGEKNFAKLVQEMRQESHQYTPASETASEVTYYQQQHEQAQKESFMAMTSKAGIAYQTNGANRSPLRGIKEHENEDLSEFTYRPSNVYIPEEPALQQASHMAPQFDQPLPEHHNCSFDPQYIQPCASETQAEVEQRIRPNPRKRKLADCLQTSEATPIEGAASKKKHRLLDPTGLPKQNETALSQRLSSGLARMSLQPKATRPGLHEARSGSIRSRSRGEEARLTSEERMLLRAQEEKAQFKTMKSRWQTFYQKTVKPSYELPYVEQIQKQKTWVQTALTQAKPFNLSLSTCQQTLRHQSLGCGSEGLRSMVFHLEKGNKKEIAASASMAPAATLRRSLSGKAANNKAIESRKKLRIQQFQASVRKRRSLSLGPDDRLMVESLPGNLFDPALAQQQHQNWSKGHTITTNAQAKEKEDDFQLHTRASAYKRPKRKPLSIGASSCSSQGAQFKARPMPNFQITSPQTKVFLADKHLTVAMPFDLETEKRSLSRVMSKPKKPELVLDDFSDENKENSMQLAPIKRQAQQRHSKRKGWPSRERSVGLGDSQQVGTLRERLTIARSPLLETKMRADRRRRLDEQESDFL